MKSVKKLASRRGETLTETLVGVLIVGLASVVLASMAVASSNMNAAAIKADKALYSAVSNAEQGTLKDGDPAAGGTTDKIEVTVTLDGAPTGGGTSYGFEATLCGDKDLPLCSYRYHKEVTPP